MTNGAGSAGGSGALEPDAPDVPPLRPAAPAPPGTTPLEPSDPVKVGDYDLVATLGIGGMGTVYLGQAANGTRVAVKVVHSHLAADAEFRSRFATEIQAAQRVPAFCTAPVRDSGNHLGRPYLVTDYIEGVPLSRLIADDGRMDPATLHGIAVGAAAALTAIHGAGVVHRDLKPSNVLVALGGVRIIDFGIARSLDIAHSHTRTGVILGSLGWASPEQLNAAPATPAMDVFGWGCLVAYAALGRHPYGGEEAATRAWRILNAEPELHEVPESVRDLVEAALRRDPAHRPSARQLLLALTQASSVASDDFTPPPPSKRTEYSRRGRRDAAVAAAVIPLGVALVFGVVKATTGALPILVDPVRDDSPAVTTTVPGERDSNPAAVTNPTSTSTARQGNGPGGPPTQPGTVTTAPGAVVTTPPAPPPSTAPTPTPTSPSPTPTPTDSPSDPPSSPPPADGGEGLTVPGS